MSKATGIHLNLGPVSAATNGIGDLAMKAAPIAALAIPGLGPAIGGALSAIPGVGAVMSAASKIPGLSSAADWIGAHGKDLLQAGAGLDAAQQQQQARDTLNQARDYASAAYEAKAPLRAQGIAGMMHPQTPSLAGIGYDSPGNAYGAPYRAGGGGTMPAAPQLAPVGAMRGGPPGAALVGTSQGAPGGAVGGLLRRAQGRAPQ